MKQKIKEIIPDFMYLWYRKIKYTFLIYTRYLQDAKKYSKYSIKFDNHNSFDNLRGRITLNYHNIEKGLTHTHDMRLGFGKSAISDLLVSMDEFIEHNYDINDERFQTALNVLKQYIKVHKLYNYDVSFLENKINQYKESYIIEAGAKPLYLDNKVVATNFEQLVNNRHSIRDYGSDIIADELIELAINIAKKTPSACNRQPWKVYVVKQSEIIQKLLSLQGGLNGNAHHLQYLLLITSNKAFYRWDHERNQNYIDGGLFSATLLYSLESLNIAACPLHCDLSISIEKQIRDLLKIEDSEDLINFISCGSFPDEIIVPVSYRDNYKSFTVYL